MRFSKRVQWVVMDRAGVAIGFFGLDEKEQAIYTAKSFGGVAKLMEY